MNGRVSAAREMSCFAVAEDGRIVHDVMSAITILGDLEFHSNLSSYNCYSISSAHPFLKDFIMITFLPEENCRPFFRGSLYDLGLNICRCTWAEYQWSVSNSSFYEAKCPDDECGLLLHVIRQNSAADQVAASPW